MAARDALDGFTGDVLVVYGDTPLLTTATLQRMLDARRAPAAPAVVLLGFRPVDAGAYGRLVLDADGGLDRVVEARDATADQLTIPLCNAGVMAVDGRRLFRLLDRVGSDNAKGEYYLTDIVGIARGDGLACAVVEGDESELLGINARSDLAAAERVVQTALRQRAMAGGATLVDPETVYFCWDTELGRDVTVGPCVVFGPGVKVGDRVEIRAFSQLEGTVVGDGALVGPFARLRPGAAIAADAHIGNFVEIKNATVETGAKVNHLTYIGDARIGAAANIGAGTITCNYDGFAKHRTDVGAGAFIGSNTCLVAPVRIGDGAIVGASSAITKNVPAGALALTRGPLTVLAGWAERFRQRRAADRAAKAGAAAATGG
jgi:bifunctional UDP-N-acetylglucosamine pyrophosphorylase/glucosamine-1-phosphate N-acetyltransferase